MRISTNTIFDLGVSSIQQQTSTLIRSQQQVAAGRRILSPADDPVASARVLEVTQSSRLSQQYDVNMGSASSSLGLEENILGSVGDLVQNVQEIAVYAGNPTLDNSNRASLATELRSRYQELLGLANSTDGNGQYLFSGYKGSTLPFGETAAGVVSYFGDSGQRLIQISSSRQIPVNDSGSDVFQRIKNGNGTFVSRPLASNGGTGVIDPGTVHDLTKWESSSRDFTIRFAANTLVSANPLNAGPSGAVAAGIVDQAAWDASGRSLQVTVAAGAVAGTYDYTFTDAVLGSRTINYDPATQDPMPVQLTGAPLNVGAELVLSGTPAAGDAFTIAPSPTPGWTYDILDNATGASVVTGQNPPGWSSQWRTYTSGQTISLASQGSEPAFDFGVSTYVRGEPAAGDEFTLKASQNEDLFAIIDNLITTLEQGVNRPVDSARFQNDLNLAMTGLNNAQTNVSSVRASVGARMKEIDSVKSTGEDLQLQFQQTLSQLQDLDYAEAISDLTRQQMQLEAAQKSFMAIQNLSLFNFINP